jgi:uncharacterized membrane protein YczE
MLCIVHHLVFYYSTQILFCKIYIIKSNIYIAYIILLIYDSVVTRRGGYEKNGKGEALCAFCNPFVFYRTWNCADEARRDWHFSGIFSSQRAQPTLYGSVLWTWTILSNCAFLIGQILILRRKFKPIQFLQIPLFFLCGIFTDFGVWITRFLPQNSYMAKLLFVLAGCVVLGFGIALGCLADVMLNAPEAFVKALSLTIKREFGTVKIVCDICLVLLSALLSVAFFKGKLIGIREGTIISAILVGCFVSVFCRLLRKPLAQMLETTR